MQFGSLVKTAAQCREQAREFSANERKLLLRVAAALDQVASAEEIRDQVAATRCW